MLRSHGVHGRVIVHADLDCFYAQVEHVRLGIPTSTPLAVQQWDGIIAVNYSARKFGVKRGDRAEAALGKCPEIKLVHVETIGADSVADEEPGASAVGGVTGPGPERGTCKVSLERYRTASFAIMTIFQAHCRRVERASIDEAYLDLTEEAAKLCQESEAGGAENVANAPETDLQGTAGHRVDPASSFDRALLAGARLTAAMRLAVEQELGFTVSAGIASNKVLAKLASSINKPNKQTVVPARAASDMLDMVPLRDVRGLGGKLGEAVVSWSKAETASDLKKFSEQELVGKFGPKTGEWLWRACRGMDNEPVTPNLKPKSLSVCKSFTPVRDVEALLKWMRLLCTELAHRIGVDRKAWGRRVTKLTLQVISLKSGTSAHNQRGSGGGDKRSRTLTRSRTIDIPGGGEPPTATSLVSEAMAIFAKTENALPCSRLALTAHDFSDLVSGRGSIASFLRANPNPKASILSNRGGGGGDGGGGASSPVTAAEDGVAFDDGRDAASRGRAETTTRPQVVRSSNGEPLGGTRSADSSRSNRTKDRDNPTLAVAEGIKSRRGEVCPKCGKTLPEEEDLREHLDFHYAEGLQERYSREGDVARDMVARTSDAGGLSSKRRRDGNKGKAGKRGKGGREGRRIDSFFKPA